MQKTSTLYWGIAVGWSVTIKTLKRAVTRKGFGLHSNLGIARGRDQVVIHSTQLIVLSVLSVCLFISPAGTATQLDQMLLPDLTR